MDITIRCSQCKELFIRRIKNNIGRSDAEGKGLVLWRSEEEQAARLREEAVLQRLSQRRLVEELQKQDKLGPVHEVTR